MYGRKVGKSPTQCPSLWVFLCFFFFSMAASKTSLLVPFRVVIRLGGCSSLGAWQALFNELSRDVGGSVTLIFLFFLVSDSSIRDIDNTPRSGGGVPHCVQSRSHSPPPLNTLGTIQCNQQTPPHPPSFTERPMALPSLCSPVLSVRIQPPFTLPCSWTADVW